jgi:hypothetical protein
MANHKGHKKFKPTDETRQTVKTMAAIGIPEERIARCLNCSLPTLLKYFRFELDTASDLATTEIGGKLFRTAMGGNVGAMIFWMKTRAGWRDTEIVADTAIVMAPPLPEWHQQALKQAALNAQLESGTMSHSPQLIDSTAISVSPTREYPDQLEAERVAH